MNILFVVYKVNDLSNPNINLIRNLENELKEHNIYYMGFDTDKTKKNDFCFYYPWEDKASKFASAFLLSTFLQKIILILRNPFISILGLCKIKHIDVITLFYRKHIEKICRKYNIDAVISVSAPFYTAKSISKAHINAKKLIIMFDPYAHHFYYKSEQAQKQEQKCISSVNRVFVPKLIRHHYHQDNVDTIEFPCMIPDSSKSATPLLDKNKINLVFAGSFYHNIRSPEPLFRLVSAANNPDIHITIVGGTLDDFADELNGKYSDFIKNHVTLAGRVPKEQARLYINEADIVLNIGNTIDNMLPSKVFECISTGKRVLNLYQIENCPSLPYFEKYGNCFSLYTQKVFDDNDIQQFNEFVKTENNIAASEILDKFKDATPQFVAKQLIDAINN